MFKKKDNTKTDNTNTNTDNNTSTGTVSGNDDFPLKKGSRGTNVKHLQKYLISKLQKIQVDMTNTEDSRNYARELLDGFVADGDFGDKTAKVLNFVIPNATQVDEITYMYKAMLTY